MNPPATQQMSVAKIYNFYLPSRIIVARAQVAIGEYHAVIQAPRKRAGRL